MPGTAKAPSGVAQTGSLSEAPQRKQGASSVARPDTSLLGDEPVTDGEMGQARALEGVHGVGRARHHRLAVQVEGGVEHGADAGAALELADHRVVVRVPGSLE